MRREIKYKKQADLAYGRGPQAKTRSNVDLRIIAVLGSTICWFFFYIYIFLKDDEYYE